MAQLTHAPSIRNLPAGQMENIKKIFEPEGGKQKSGKQHESSPSVNLKHKNSSSQPGTHQTQALRSTPVKKQPVTVPPDPPTSVHQNFSKTQQKLKHYSGPENTDTANEAHPVNPWLMKRKDALQDQESKKEEDVSSNVTKSVKPKWLTAGQGAEEKTADVKCVKSENVVKPEMPGCDRKKPIVTDATERDKPVPKSRTNECIAKPKKTDQSVLERSDNTGQRSRTKDVFNIQADVDSKKAENDKSCDKKPLKLSGSQMDSLGEKENGPKDSDGTMPGVLEARKMFENINKQSQESSKIIQAKSAPAPPRPSQPPKPRPRSRRQNSIGCASEYEYTPIWVECNTQFKAKNTPHAESALKPKKLNLPEKPISSASSCVSSDARKKTFETSAPLPPLPPQKPPRTGAHDVYIETKIKKMKEVELIDNEIYESSRKDTEESSFKSVKERMSSLFESQQAQAQQQTKDDSVICRPPPPFRPPLPKKRPFSIATDIMSFSQPNSPAKTRPKLPTPEKTSPKMVRHDYEEIKETDIGPRNIVLAAVDELTRKPLQRFPLRKSFSSDNLCSIKTCDDIPVYIDPKLSIGFNKFNDDRYEAYVDEEGYAVPHAFVKKHADKHALDKTMSNEGTGLRGRLGGFRKRFGSEGQQRSVPVQEQDPTKVNKRKLNQIKQKLNDAFAALQKYVKRDQDIDSDENAGDLDALSVDSDDSVDHQEIMRRVTYVSTVKAKTYQSIRKKNEFSSKIYPQLFEYALVVGLKGAPGGQGYKPYIIHKFPEIVDSNVSVPLFCFPDAAEFESTGTSVSESYHFVLTNIDGGKVYGYCRRTQPPESKLPEVICIISPVDAFNMYNSLLNEVEKKRKVSLDLAQELLAASFGRPLPNPGKVINIRSLDQAGEMETIFLNRPTDSRLENVNYECLLSYLGTEKLLKIFSTLLMERRVLICSKHLSSLSHTIHALAALLYPFQWQHIYIPILPQDMLDVCASPTPFLIGILSSHLKQVLTLPLEEIIIVDLDKKQIVRSEGDESTIIPRKVQKALKTAINMCKIDAEAQSSQWLMVSEAFMRLFVETVGHFGEHIITQQDGKKIFLKERFIAEAATKGIRQMLEWFTETQMFEVFITHHTEKKEWATVDLFMSRLAEFQKSDGSSGSVGLGKKMRKFFHIQ